MKRRTISGRTSARKQQRLTQYDGTDQVEVYDYDVFCRVLSAKYGRLSKQLKTIARFITDNPNDIALDTAAHIAERLNMQPSSLVRFARALGFEGFLEIQRIFRERVREQIGSGPSVYKARIKHLKEEKNNQDLIGSIRSKFVNANSVSLQHMKTELDLTAFEQAVAAIRKATGIYIFGQRRSFPAAIYAYYTLEELGFPVYLVDSIGGLQTQQLRNMKRGDLFIPITFPAYSPDVVEAAKSAKQTGATVVAITESSISPVVGHSDVSFYCDRFTVSGFRSIAETLCLIQVLAITAGIEKVGNNDKAPRE